MQKVFITGGTRGIGLAIVKAFLKEGSCVHICGRNPPEKTLSGKAGNVIFHRVDVREPQACKNVIKVAHDAMGGLDVLVNNAGGTVMKEAKNCSFELAQSLVNLNFLSCFWMAKTAFPFMENNTHASIINIASIAADGIPTNVALYGAAKAALLSLTKSLAIEWAPIRVNALIPGPALTEGLKKFPGGNSYVDVTAKKIPLGRLADPEDIAHACVFLASSKASYISGTSIRLDGGGYFVEYEKHKN